VSNVLVTGKSRTDRTKVVEVRVDPFSGSAVMIDSEHAHIHAGEGYDISGRISALGNGATAYFYIVPTVGIHWRDFTIKSTKAPTLIELFEDPTIAVDGEGTPVTPINRNRYSSNTSGISVYSGPTITDDGTILYTDETLDIGGPTKGGDVGNLPLEWVLTPASTYALKITNNGGVNADLTYQFFWYELNI